MKKIVYLILITLIPGVELRGSIPIGIFNYWPLKGEPIAWPVVVAVCVTANILLGFATFWLLDYVVPVISKLGPVGRWYARFAERKQKQLNASIEKWGKWALAVFIGIPLPGTGAISGAIAAQIVGMKFRRFLWANIMGVVMAGAIVSSLCLAGGETVAFARKIHLLPAAEQQEQAKPVERDNQQLP